MKSDVLLKPVILSKDKATNSIKVDNACQMVDYLFKGDEKISEKVLTKYLSDKPHLTKQVIKKSPIVIF